ncbi:MAG TPA: RNA polymerase sigma factor [Phycisphaerales bacterium]|nr:RNA polymerase sigma factor [Phycisphaerales bacterium]
MDRDSEAQLVKRALAGDPQATAELIRAHQAPLYSFMLRMTRGDAALAEDITQEAFYRAIKALDRYDARWRFSTWVFTIARRLFLTWQARLTPRAAGDALDDMPAVAPVWGVAGWTVERAEERDTQRGVIDRALAHLSPPQREVVVLHHQLDWPVELIAEALGMPEGTVKSHLFRARARLRGVLAAGLAGDGDAPEASAASAAARSGGGGRP